MLWSVNDVVGHRIEAADGEVGSVADFFFDDRTSAIRYLAVDTGGWLTGRKVLLAPAAFGPVDVNSKTFTTRLTKAQVKDSPDITSDKPVSRREEEALHTHYGWEPYWAGGPEMVGLAPYWGAAGYATPFYENAQRSETEAAAQRAAEAELERGDPNLRSAREIINYYIEAADGEIGHVEDLLVDDEGWRIRYLIVDTRNWLPGRKVVVSPQWLERIDWAGETVTLGQTREQIRNSPEYDPQMTLDRGFEERLHRHYERTAYWA
jgi:sporulation protein YlmC with PRC-barrel domain